MTNIDLSYYVQPVPARPISGHREAEALSGFHAFDTLQVDLLGPLLNRRLPAGWSMEIDAASGKKYYVNPVVSYQFWRPSEQLWVCKLGGGAKGGRVLMAGWPWRGRSIGRHALLIRAEWVLKQNLQWVFVETLFPSHCSTEECLLFKKKCFRENEGRRGKEKEESQMISEVWFSTSGMLSVIRLQHLKSPICAVGVM
jgi:hypothetical protein